VNGMLAERATGSSVIAALAKYGVALNHENVSNWKHGGFQDWLIEQEWQAEVSVQREYPTGLDPDLPRLKREVSITTPIRPSRPVALF